ncbi:protein CutA homolog isoform X2 [Mustela erminea]|uniref:protein CutA homolog isoform X2 n=1 Tax=Mustela erminea TaxID=36723 RepID=UPI001387056F|nr:protein CutA homolog isoform X2 [Mustela erminea]
MDRLGSRCPLPGYLRPSVLICLLILATAFLSYPMLRTLSLQLRSAVAGSYVSGTYSIVFVNCPNEQIARDIARYFWNGEIEEATEILLLIKTKTSKVHALSSYIRLPKGIGTALRSSKGLACCIKDGKIKTAHPVSGTSLPAPGSQVEEGREGRACWVRRKT